MSQKEKIIIINPFDETQLQLLSTVSGDNIESIIKKLKEISLSTNEETYKEKKKKSNSVDEVIAVAKANRLKGIFSITGEKDISIGLITVHYSDYPLKRIIPLGTDFAQKTLGIKEVFIKINKDDLVTQRFLEAEGYECLGVEEDSITYLMDELSTTKNSAMRVA